MTRSIEVIAWVFGSYVALLALFGAVWLMLNALHKGKGRSLHELRQLADASKLWFLNPLSERTIYLWKWAGLIVLIVWFFIASVMQSGKPHEGEAIYWRPWCSSLAAMTNAFSRHSLISPQENPPESWAAILSAFRLFAAVGETISR